MRLHDAKDATGALHVFHCDPLLGVGRSWVGVALAASTMIPLVSRMNAEEALLHSQFGEEYDSYRTRTWRMVPWIY